MTPHDIILIGAGQNSLVAAFYLARAGFKPLILERRSTVGGAASTIEFHPGFRASVLDAPGPLAPGIAADMQLASNAGAPSARESDHAARLFAPSPDARALLLYADAARSARNIEAFSKSDAARYLELGKIFESASGLIRDLLLMTPPDVDALTSSAIWDLLRAGRTFRGLGKKNMHRLLRWGPMAVADFAAEFFETELLRAVIAAPGISGAAAGPWSAGTSALLLLRLGAGGLPDGNPPAVSGLPASAGALSEAIAAAAIRAGVEIRTNAEVARILVKNGAATGVTLKSGEEIAAKAVVSGADPKRTFLNLLEPVHLAPGFLVKMRHYRSQGTVARVLLALDALPNFTALKTSSPAELAAALSGRIHIGPDIDYLERAFDASKYGDFSPAPYLNAAIPSLADPSLAPACPDKGRAGKHVMAISMQYAPYNVNARASSSNCHSERMRPASSEESASHPSASPENWPSHREALADAVIKALAEYAPDLPSKILARRVITPLDLEQDYGLTGGHISHGELALDQLFTMRPLLGFARYSTPIRGLFLCGPGTHPGIAFAGASGLNSSREIARALRSKPH